MNEEEDVRAEMETEWYLQRLDQGLFGLQMIDYILAWLAMEDDGVRTRLATILLHTKSEVPYR
jgi:beta-catenin-like protein 1